VDVHETEDLCLASHVLCLHTYAYMNIHIYIYVLSAFKSSSVCMRTVLQAVGDVDIDETEDLRLASHAVCFIYTCIDTYIYIYIICISILISMRVYNVAGSMGCGYRRDEGLVPGKSLCMFLYIHE